MPRFFRRLAEGVFDVEDLKFRSRELAEFMNAASVKYGFDKKSVVLVGYSNGANIAAGMLLTGYFIPAGAVLFRPMVPLTPDRPQRLGGTKIFISAGESDNVVPRGETERLAHLLVDSGADVRLNWVNGTHALTREEVEMAAGWLLQNVTI